MGKMVVMKRYLNNYIQKDMKRKIVLLTGPRQTGKTTLSKMLKESFDYFNYDNAEHRLSLLEKSWDRSRKKSQLLFLRKISFQCQKNPDCKRAQA